MAQFCNRFPGVDICKLDVESIWFTGDCAGKVSSGKSSPSIVNYDCALK